MSAESALVSLLEVSARVLEGHPRWLWEKDPEYEGGLNINAVNKAAIELGLKPIIVYSKTDKLRTLTISDPDEVAPITVTIWCNEYFERPNQATIDRVISFLRKWKDASVSVNIAPTKSPVFSRSEHAVLKEIKKSEVKLTYDDLENLTRMGRQTISNALKGLQLKGSLPAIYIKKPKKPKIKKIKTKNRTKLD